MNGQTLKKAFVALPAGAEAVYNSSGLEYYRHADWLGSSRLVSTPSRTVSGDLSSSPFGVPHAGLGTVAASFTGQNQDTAPSLYDFPAREYGQVVARWPSPDPLGGNVGDPQSLNRYSYVLNNPESLVDPLGACLPGQTCPQPPPPPGQQAQDECSLVWQAAWVTSGGVTWNAGSYVLECGVVYPSSPTLGGSGYSGGEGGSDLGGGAPSGGAAPSPAAPQTQSQNRWVCAAQTADKYSIAGALGTTNKTGFWANVFNGFAGNTFSGLTLAFSGGGNKYRFATSVVNAPPPVGFAVTANAINAVTTPAPISELGLTETVGSDLLGEGLGYTVASLKIGYDAVSYGAALYKCW